MIAVPKIGPIPAVGLGTWRLWGQDCEQSIKIALDLGYRHIDTADLYQNHIAIGQAIQGFPREELFLVSKLMEKDLVPDRVASACERFLQELNTPYLDLLLIHWPSQDHSLVKTLEAMQRLQQKQKVRFFGVSNFPIALLQEIEGFPILTNQVELHPHLQEKELLNYCLENGIVVTAYRPIQKGEVAQDPLLQKLGDKYSKTPTQITLRWLFQRQIASIPKATSPTHLKENLAIFDFSLSSEDMAAIAKLDSGKRYVLG